MKHRIVRGSTLAALCLVLASPAVRAQGTAPSPHGSPGVAPYQGAPKTVPGTKSPSALGTDPLAPKAQSPDEPNGGGQSLPLEDGAPVTPLEPNAPAAKGAAKGARVGPGKAPPANLPIEEIRAFAEVFAKIKSDYVEEVSDKTLLENAIRGMLSGLDPHSAYLDGEDYRELREGASGEFGGLGIEVGTEDGFLKVIAPIDDTPAQRAGIKAGDLIIRLDETPVKGIAIGEAVKRMRGKPGSKIILTILREGQEKPMTFTLVRAQIRVQSVKSRILEPGFGYVRIAHFQSNTGADLVTALARLKADNHGPLRGIILDLRNNPGGILGAAVSVADAFLEKGRIVYTEGRNDQAQLSFSAKPDDLIDHAPLVVVVNGGSASASEIVAGALQDHHRGLVVGSPTFGKGSVQTILPMNKSAALKITTARYFTPSGRSIQAEGIKPDILFDKVKIAGLERGDETASIREADLTGHLSNPNGGKAGKGTDGGKRAGQSEGKSEGKPAAGAAGAASLAATDYELHESLNLLKGMALLKTYNSDEIPVPPPTAAKAGAGGAGKAPGKR
jgi:carboxyl-terminal processing protease